MAGSIEREIHTMQDDEITIRDLVLDDLVGYRDFFEEEDEHILDRQATLVLLEIYGTNDAIPASLPLILKRWVALNTEMKLLPALRTFIAKREKRSDVQRDGYVTYYDQLRQLELFAEDLQRRITALQAEAQLALAEEYNLTLLRYDRPGFSRSNQTFVTYDPYTVGKALFPKS